MRRYRIESAVYNELGSATIATPDDEGAWVSADDALKVEAERDRLATALGAYIEGRRGLHDENDQLRARVAELEARRDALAVELGC